MGELKRNCWDVMECGREIGGAKTAEEGMCPAAMETEAHGIHGGINAGRACWAVAGTVCGGQLQGSYAEKLADCMKCDFYRLVRDEEGSAFLSGGVILRRIGA